MKGYTLTPRAKFIALFSYAVSMGYLEAAVVVYLRTLYYPQGFDVTMPSRFTSLIYQVDLFREAATIIMLLAVGYLSFTKIKDRICAFLWLFAVWDLSYYIFLKLILGWPSSLKTLDVLFLIPVPWVAPVWLPISISTATLAVTTYLLFIKKHV